MSTIIHISNRQIQIVAAKGSGNGAKPARAYVREAPEGSIINGIVMDPDAFIADMKEFFIQTGVSTKDVTLIIDSSKIAGKRLEIPKLSKPKTLDFIRREMVDMDKENVDEVYSYIELTGDKNAKLRSVYANSVDIEFVRDYVEIFKEIGVTLKGIYSGVGTMIKMIERTAAKTAGTFIAQIADDNILTNILWVDGKFYYYSSQRCFQEPGTEAYYDECVRALSQLTQFMQANQIESPLDVIYVGGIANMDINMYQVLAASSRIETRIEEFDCGLRAKYGAEFDLHTFLQSVAGLTSLSNESNLLHRFTASRKESKVDSTLKKRIALVAGTLVVMLLALASVIFVKLQKQKELDDLKASNENQVTQMQLEDYDRVSSEMAAVVMRLNSMDLIERMVDSYPGCNSAVVKEIEDAAAGYATIEVNSFMASSGTVAFVANAEEVKNVNQFIAKLLEKDIFSDVNYTGYTYDDGEQVYNIHVICTLSENAGK